MSPRRPWMLVVASLLTATVLAASGPASAATPPIGRWALKGNLKDTAGSSLILTKVGSPSFQTVNVDSTSRKALVFAPGEGLHLAGIPKPARGTYSIEIQLELNDLSGYRRILSFGPNDQDAGLYLEGGAISLFDHKVTADPVASTNIWSSVRVTRNGANGQMYVYVDGTRYLGYKDVRGEYRLRGGIVVFLQDDGGENGSGAAGRVVFWDKVVPAFAIGGS